MNEGLRREEELFDAARRLRDAGERAAFLDAACAGDAESRRRLEGLLGAQSEADALFRPLAPPISEVEYAGTVIGRYRLLEKIGEGGMGLVYRAEQQEPVKRQVALKIIKLGMDTRQVVTRFEAERQALALMDHPHIAKVLDGGATASGRPYFVMELVLGVPITEFCAKNQLPVADRLGLFVRVCQAVQHAHQKGIIHRDLKPSNVLVTRHDGVPVPKVIDFGVAKAIDQRLTEQTLLTRHATLIGTPAYMSPEQAELSGLDVDTRADIYSLGVLLYELLTGTQPFPEQRLRSVAYAEMQRIIAQEAPERPSTRLRKSVANTPAPTPKSRASGLDADLDWIALKCLEKDRNRRYETANGLAADLKRFLANEPIVARPPSRWYEFQKTVRRHKVGFATTAAVVAALMAGGVVSGWALWQERLQRKAADARLSAALEFMDKVLSEVAPGIANLAGAAAIQQSLSGATIEFVRRLGTGAGGDPSLRVALARALLGFGSAQNPGGANTLGAYDSGLRLAQQAVLLLSEPTPQLSEAQRVNLLLSARFAVVQCLYGLGRWEDASARSEELEPLFDQLERIPDRSQWARRQRWNTRMNAGYSQLLAGRPEQCLAVMRAGLGSDWARSLTQNSAGDELEVLANMHDNLATVQGFHGQFDVMLTNALAAGHIWTNLAERFPRNARYLVGQVEGWWLQGWALVGQGRTNDGLALLEQSRRTIEGLVTQDPKNDSPQTYRAVAAATQALAFAAWAAEPGASVAERHDRLGQAGKYLAEAGDFSCIAKSKEAEARVALARAGVEAAKLKLEPNGVRDRRP